jgi:hypothetical protein
MEISKVGGVNGGENGREGSQKGRDRKDKRRRQTKSLSQPHHQWEERYKGSEKRAMSGVCARQGNQAGRELQQQQQQKTYTMRCDDTIRW